MIEKFDVKITPFDLFRTIHVYLPNDYFYSCEKYPVMYMFDGHNLFYDEDATYGKSWGLREFMDDYDKPLIIVGIECNHEGNERLNEYCPYDVEKGFFGPITGCGKQLMDWVIDELKPLIDKKYRTYPFRECTGIAGSSMGGLMALYTVIKYNRYFSKAACISPAISICMNELKQELKDNQIDADTKVYFSFGKKEVRNVEWALKNILYFNDYLINVKAGSYINVVENGEHNESSWQKENSVYLNYLWK